MTRAHEAMSSPRRRATWSATTPRPPARPVLQASTAIGVHAGTASSLRLRSQAPLAQSEPLSEPLSQRSQASHRGQIRPPEPTWDVWVATRRIRYAVPNRLFRAQTRARRSSLSPYLSWSSAVPIRPLTRSGLSGSTLIGFLPQGTGPHRSWVTNSSPRRLENRRSPAAVRSTGGPSPPAT